MKKLGIWMASKQGLSTTSFSSIKHYSGRMDHCRESISSITIGVRSDKGKSIAMEFARPNCDFLFIINCRLRVYSTVISLVVSLLSLKLEVIGVHPIVI